MEKLYKKNSNGRYESVGYGGVPDLGDGIWLVQSEPGRKSISSLFWKVGNIKKPVDVVTHASIQAMSNEVSRYMSRLLETDSEEFLEAKEICGGHLKESIQLSRISIYDITMLLLRKVATITDR